MTRVRGKDATKDIQKQFDTVFEVNEITFKVGL